MKKLHKIARVLVDKKFNAIDLIIYIGIWLLAYSNDISVTHKVFLLVLWLIFGCILYESCYYIRDKTYPEG